jgi:monoamine oxidase
MTWETSEDIESTKIKKNNKRPDFTFVAFSGAIHSQDHVDLASDEAREAALLKQLRKVYPGIDTQITNSRFVNWPRKLFTQGSYYSPPPRKSALGAPSGKLAT